MKTGKKMGEREKAKSSAFGFGPMGPGMSEMMKRCTGQEIFPDCLIVMEEMKKQNCAPNKDADEAERKKK